MPNFIAIQDILEPIYSVNLRLPMAAGTWTGNVSEDEALILRALPDQFREQTTEQRETWTGQSPMNRMVENAELRKGVPAGDANEVGEPTGGETDDE